MPLLEEAYAEAAPLMESDPGHGGGHSGDILAPSAGGGVLPVWACDAMLKSRASVMSKQTNYHIKKVCALLLLLLVSSIAVVGPAFLASLLVAPISGAACDGAAAGLQHPATRARLGRAFSTSASNGSAMSTATAMDELSFVDLRTTETTPAKFDPGAALARMNAAAMTGGYAAVQEVYLRELTHDAQSSVDVLATLFRSGTDPANLNGLHGVCNLLPLRVDGEWKDRKRNGGSPPGVRQNVVSAEVATIHLSADSCTVQPEQAHDHANGNGVKVLEALGTTMVFFDEGASARECFPGHLRTCKPVADGAVENAVAKMEMASCLKDETTQAGCENDPNFARERDVAVQSLYRRFSPQLQLRENVDVLATLFHFGTNPDNPQGEGGACTDVLPRWSSRMGWQDQTSGSGSGYQEIENIVPAGVANMHFSASSCTAQQEQTPEFANSVKALKSLGAVMVRFNDQSARGEECFPGHLRTCKPVVGEAVENAVANMEGISCAKDETTQASCARDLRIALESDFAVQNYYRKLSPQLRLRENVDVLVTLFRFGTNSANLIKQKGATYDFFPLWSEHGKNWKDQNSGSHSEVPEVENLVSAEVANEHFSPGSCTAQQEQAHDRAKVLRALGTTMLNSFARWGVVDSCFPSHLFACAPFVAGAFERAEAQMRQEPADKDNARKAYRAASGIYTKELTDELRKRDEIRADFFRISRFAVEIDLETFDSDIDIGYGGYPDVLWEDESFVRYAMMQVSCSKNEMTARSCAADANRWGHALGLLKSIYASRVPTHLQKSVDILEAFFRFATGSAANVRHEKAWLCGFLPRFDGTWRSFGFAKTKMPVEIAERFFGNSQDQCARPDLDAVQVRAFAALGAQMLGQPECVPKHLRICPAVVAGLLAADPTTSAEKWSTKLATELGSESYVTEGEVTSLKNDPRVAVFALPGLADGTISVSEFTRIALLQQDSTTRDRAVWDAMLIIEKGPLDTRQAKASAVAKIARGAMELSRGVDDAKTTTQADGAGFWLRAVKHHRMLTSLVLDVFGMCAASLLPFQAVSKVMAELSRGVAIRTTLAGLLVDPVICQPGEGFDFTPLLAGEGRKNEEEGKEEKAASTDRAAAVASLQRARSNMAKKLVCANRTLAELDGRNLLPKDLLGDDDFAKFLGNVANEDTTRRAEACRGSVVNTA
ncbi:unnamed protein product [Amoebophrya sp. A25]|nr:unnamed protein product [Amoebophrya sp. A25]|eukprot:GSA25T00026211001.1